MQSDIPLTTTERMSMIDTSISGFPSLSTNLPSCMSSYSNAQVYARDPYMRELIRSNMMHVFCDEDRDKIELEAKRRREEID